MRNWVHQEFHFKLRKHWSIYIGQKPGGCSFCLNVTHSELSSSSCCLYIHEIKKKKTVTNQLKKILSDRLKTHTTTYLPKEHKMIERTGFMKTNFPFLHPKTSRIDSFWNYEVPFPHHPKNEREHTDTVFTLTDYFGKQRTHKRSNLIWVWRGRFCTHSSHKPHPFPTQKSPQ